MSSAGVRIAVVVPVYGNLPETKNHSVEEVTELHERQAAGERAALPAEAGANAA